MGNRSEFSHCAWASLASTKGVPMRSGDREPDLERRFPERQSSQRSNTGGRSGVRSSLLRSNQKPTGPCADMRKA